MGNGGIGLEVVLVEPTGSETMVVGRLGSQTVSGVFHERISLRPGDRLDVVIDPRDVHLFDAQGNSAI